MSRRLTRPSDTPGVVTTVRTAARTRLWPWAIALFAASLVAVLTSARGELVGDNHFALHWAPDRLLSDSTSIWESNQGLGRFRLDFWPAPTVFFTIVRGIGLSAALAGSVWHALLLTVAGVGMIAVVRLFRQPIGLEHAIAAVVYTFGPFTAAFLLPSNLFLAYALAPWLLVAFVRGTRDSDAWRWAAVFALLVFAYGNINYPSLFFAALPIIPMALYLVWVDGTTTWRRVGGYVLRTGLLVVLVSAAAIMVSRFASLAFSENLALTETASHIALNSSWSESLRGLGFWLVYYSDETGPLLPQLGHYFGTPLVLVTFALPVVALLTLALDRRRVRLLFTGMMLLGAAVMVGINPPDDPSPYGRTLRNLFDDVPSLLSFRGSFKAGPMLMLGLAALVGFGFAALWHRARDHSRRWGIVAALGVAAVVIAAGYPFWTGTLYAKDVKTSEPPEYWQSAATWLDEQPKPGRVLVIPSAVSPRFRWGGWSAAADDIIEGLVNRDAIARLSLSRFQGTADSGNLVGALDDYLGSGSYEAGSIAPIARRLGIRYILVRNDLDWQSGHRPRPAAYQVLRKDPDLRLAKSFGDQGQNVFDPRQEEVALETTTDLEKQLRPIEIFEVQGPIQLVRAASTVPLLVSGDGHAWPELSVAGMLEGTGPIRYTGDLGIPTLTEALEAGAPLAITDTNRRRVERIGGRDSATTYTYTLGPGQELPEREVRTLFDRPGTQSVAWFPDAKRIVASGFGTPLGRAQTSFRPSLAFDGDPTTTWRASTLEEDGGGQWVRADLREPTTVSQVRIVSAPTFPGQPRATRGHLSFSDGSTIPFDLSNDKALVQFDPRETTSVRVDIDEVHPALGLVSPGLSEISIPGLDLREHIQLPTGVLDRAERDPELAAAVEEAPVAYLFRLLPQDEARPVEPTMARRFKTADARAFTLGGRLGSETELRGRRCRPGFLQIDGAEVAVRSLGRGEFEACAPIDLAAGWHTLTTTSPAKVVQANLLSGEIERSAPPGLVVSSTTSRASAEATVKSRAPSSVIVAQSFDPTWHASADGRDLGDVIELDTLSGWTVERTGAYEFDAKVGAQRIYVVALVVSLIAVVACGVLIVRRRRKSAAT